MSLIIGLGNVGQKYEGTRHNVGFDVVDDLSESLSTPFEHGNGPYVVAKGRHKGRKVALIKPTTFMNRSGVAVRKALGHFKSDLQDCLIIYDDLNLPVGDIRLRNKGSHGGHNGISDIINELDTNKFPRLRIGIGNDYPRGRQVEFVLSPFEESEYKLIEEAIKKAHDAVLSFVKDGINKTMNYYN